MAIFLCICLLIGAIVTVFGLLVSYAYGMSDAPTDGNAGCATTTVGLVIAIVSAGALLARLLS